MTNQGKIILTIIALIIIGLIVVSVTQNNETTPADNTATTTPATSTNATSTATTTPGTATFTAQTHTVSYTVNGFIPSSITIDAGDTVTFVNNSNDQMWVASDPHPTHTNLSAFDARQNITSGQSWSYTFNTVGNHAYHNHSNSRMTGIVIVQ